MEDKSDIGTEAWARRVRKRARNLADVVENGYMELAEHLYMAHDIPATFDAACRPLYQVWGYETFAIYAEKELGLHFRKAQRLRRIWYRIEIELKDLPRELKLRVGKLGWTKAREILRVVTVHNAEEWIARAEETNYPELIATIQKFQSDVIEAQRSIGEGGYTPEDPLEPEPLDFETPAVEAGSGDPGLVQDGQSSPPAPLPPPVNLGSRVLPISDPTSPKSTTIVPCSEDVVNSVPVPQVERYLMETFRLYDEQAEVVAMALEAAGKLSGSTTKANNLHLICMDFLASHDMLLDGLDKPRYVAQMERLLGYRFVAIDPYSREVVYGLESLQKLAGND